MDRSRSCEGPVFSLFQKYRDHAATKIGRAYHKYRAGSWRFVSWSRVRRQDELPSVPAEKVEVGGCKKFDGGTCKGRFSSRFGSSLTVEYGLGRTSRQRFISLSLGRYPPLASPGFLQLQSDERYCLRCRVEAVSTWGQFTRTLEARARCDINCGYRYVLLVSAASTLTPTSTSRTMFVTKTFHTYPAGCARSRAFHMNYRIFTFRCVKSRRGQAADHGNHV